MIGKEILKHIISENREYIEKNIANFIRREILALSGNLKRVMVFYGVRRSGKTFILYDIFKRSPNTSLYIDLEDERLNGFDTKDFETLREAFFELNPDLLDNRNVTFLFDEVQRIEGWERFARRMLEKEKLKVYVAGSSTKIHPQQIGTSLRGRFLGVEVYPFSFRESLQTKGLNKKTDALMYGRQRILLKNYFEEYLKWGGFPEITLLKSELQRKMVLKEYMNAMYFRDLVERFEIKNIQLFDALWDMLFSSFSRKYSVNSFINKHKNRLRLSKDTVYSYYRYFLESMLVFKVKKYAESPYRRLRSPVKIYLIDTGLARRVTSEDKGRLLENVVFLELRRKAKEIYYFENGKECDFITTDERGVKSAYQVCFELTEINEKREMEGLFTACKTHNLREGTLLTHDIEDEISYKDIRIHIRPVWKWLLL